MKRTIAKLNIIRLPMPWHKPRVRKASENNADTVILLHGLWRSTWAMEPMAQVLSEAGYQTVNIPYPSFTKSLPEIVQLVENAIEQHSSAGKIHLVTHSLGGIIAREIVQNIPEERVGRLVMLAPPNQGSEIIDWISHSPPMRLIFGPAGMNLGSGKITSPTLPAHVDTAIIMGNRCLIPFFKSMLDSENDGIVSVERGKIDGMNEFHVLDADHTFISTAPEVMQLTKSFIKNGVQRQ
ncbi:MAG: esterase/lipase family protein [Akkermansiaceae bacterium]